MQSLNTFNISVNNALVLITVVSISDAVYQAKALEFEICFNGDFSLFIMFNVCFFKMKIEFEFKIYNLVLYFFKHPPANQDTCMNYAIWD